MRNFCYNTPCSAGVAHPVERHLAKVEVASSSLVARSMKKSHICLSDKCGFFELSVPCGTISTPSVREAMLRIVKCLRA